MNMPKISKEFKIGLMVAAGSIVLTLVVLGTLGYILSDEISIDRQTKEEEKMFSLDDYDVVSVEPVTFDGYLNEGENYRYDYTPPLESGELLRWIKVTLTWTDEEDYSVGIIGYTNEPDSFYIT